MESKKNFNENFKMFLSEEERKEFFGKYGLKGNSCFLPGCTGIFHVTANYDCNGMVFVEKVVYREVIDEYMETWERMPLEEAEAGKRKIITCFQCDKPAVSLDHHWPFDNEFSYCADHKAVNRS